ncbi:MAG: electron transfer flavoprotein subunit alpha/FixB family protein [Acidobacteriota bacterium]|nr:electron transfer flavoprotein subunit alpha/FixB family protein [Acidobacteriota bacterium]
MICVFIEIRDGKIKKSSLETLAEARRRADELGWPAAAVLAGSGVEKFAPELFPHGASKVYVIDDPSLEHYAPQACAAALAEMTAMASPKAIFFAASALGRDLAPRLAARLGVGLASDCTGLSVRDGKLLYTRPVYAGKALLTLEANGSPAMATLRPNVFPLLSEPAAAQGEIASVPVQIDPASVKARVIEKVSEDGAEIDVSEADIIVAGGRGLKGPENFTLLKELAALLPKAAVGASRSAVDSGWIGHQHQVGQTGKTVSPNLYMAFGVSGAIQHLAGMSSSKYIVAVNKDPEAPIFRVADYGIVGDLFEVIPALKAALIKLFSDS